MNKYQQLGHTSNPAENSGQYSDSNKVDPRVNDEGVIPKPVVSGIRKKPIMLIGQAGQGIQKVFEDTGVYDFDE